MSNPAKTNVPPPVIALASWALPGLGYVLLGQLKRGVVVGVTVVLLLVMGLLIGGVKVLEVPGYSDDGNAIVVNGQGYRDTRAGAEGKWVMKVAPLSELRDKPWAIAQVFNGPVGLAGMAWSVWASDPHNGAAGVSPASKSHARVNEIGVLYTAVAGMLNLLAILDATSRAGVLQQRAMEPEPTSA